MKVAFPQFVSDRRTFWNVTWYWNKIWRNFLLLLSFLWIVNRICLQKIRKHKAISMKNGTAIFLCIKKKLLLCWSVQEWNSFKNLINSSPWWCGNTETNHNRTCYLEQKLLIPPNWSLQMDQWRKNRINK